ncbi:NADAR family protein [Kribbella sp. NPDC056861]|uniref:NADAR family protein n=1 Tax=Kribbella sp. NPDC056861 TaxID=3154857 RepID=UPI003424F1E6
MTTGTPLSAADLLDGRHEYIFFWGDTPNRDGSVGPTCLSQWYYAPFTVDDIRYPTAEHWMMAAKARLFGDEESARAAIAAGHPQEAKAIGRQVTGFDTETWQQHRVQLVVEGNLHKFRQNEALLGYLLGTGDRVLVEASPVDRIWGIGLAADDERAAHPAQWRGLNLLGFALIQAREQLSRS